MVERRQETEHRTAARRVPKQARFVVTTARYQQRAFHTYIWHPPTDVYEEQDRFSVRVEIAGMQAAEFEISLEDRLLMIRGSRPPAAPQGAYQQMEIRFGEFISVVELSGPVDLEKTKAEYEDGFLWVVLPKLKPTKVKPKE